MSSASHFIRQYCCETTLVPTDMNTKMKQVWSLSKRVNRLMRIYGIDAQLIFQPQAAEAELLGYPTIKICTHELEFDLRIYLGTDKLWRAVEAPRKHVPETLSFLSTLPEILLIQATYALAVTRMIKIPGPI